MTLFPPPRQISLDAATNALRSQPQLTAKTLDLRSREPPQPACTPGQPHSQPSRPAEAREHRGAKRGTPTRLPAQNAALREKSVAARVLLPRVSKSAPPRPGWQRLTRGFPTRKRRQRNTHLRPLTGKGRAEVHGRIHENSTSREIPSQRNEI